jgi:hypothetical protein
MISYRSSLLFVPVQWFFSRVVTLGLWNMAKYLVVTTFCDMLGDIDLILVYECIMMSYRSNLHFIPVQWSLAELWPLDFLIKYLVISPLYFTMIWYVVLMFWYECIIISYRSTLKFVPVEWFFVNLHSLGLKFGHIFSCHHFCSLWFEILTWFLVCEYTDQVLISFQLNDFVLIYALWTINFGQLFSCHHALRYWLDIWYLEL